MTAVSQTTKTILPVEMRPRTVIRSIALCGSTHSRLNYSQQDLFKVSKKNYVWHNGMKTCTKNEEKIEPKLIHLRKSTQHQPITQNEERLVYLPLQNE